MSNVAVIGAQWGDEGKGKIVDWLSERADVVVRFQGGHNAGHTLVIGNQTYKLSLLPSGVVRPGKLSVIGSGVVVDPWAFLDELDRVRGQGLNLQPGDLLIAETAALILPVHRRLDQAREAARGDGKIGTTGRGIGPAYEDKVGRRAVRVADLGEPETLKAKVEYLAQHHNAYLRGLGEAEIDPAELLASLAGIAPRILPFAGRVWERLEQARLADKRILFEGAQACDAGHRPWHLSLRHLVEHGGRRRRRPAPGSDRRQHRTMCWALPRPTPRGSAPARSRRNRTDDDRRACWENAGASSVR